MFNEWLLDIRLRENKRLMEGESPTEVFRAQGSVGLIDMLKELKNDLRRYEKDISAGRCQPLKEAPDDGLVGQSKK